MNQEIVVTKANGEQEPFEILKLENSLRKAKAKQDAINTVVKHVVLELRSGMTTAEIYKHAFEMLKKLEHPTALRYSLRRAMMELGPSGFPFEKIVGEIFTAHGFTVRYDSMLSGRCADHEIDIVAYDDQKLIMVEAKYHNSLGIQSDLKVALYVKARIDDLKEAKFMFGKERTLDEGWLVTNTKFTSSAIKYAVCRGIKVVGWNYPAVGNLQDMIEEEGLDQLRCFSSLSQTAKAALLNSKVVLAKDVPQQVEILKGAGVGASEIDQIMREVNLLYA